MRASIILIGPPGSGKSTCGRELARLTGWRFIDTDSLVEELAGLPVAEIFRLKGEEEFRRLESRAVDELYRLSRRQPLVVAAGGGLPVFDGNLDRLKSCGDVVYLHAALDVLRLRVGDGTGRPLLAPDKGKDASGEQDVLQRLVVLRTPIYELARYKIDTSEMSPQQVAQKVIQLLKLRPNPQSAG